MPPCHQCHPAISAASKWTPSPSGSEDSGQRLEGAGNVTMQSGTELPGLQGCKGRLRVQRGIIYTI